MRINLVLYLFSAAFLLVSLKGSENLGIKPNEGLGPIILEVSTRKDIQKLLGRGNVERHYSLGRYGKFLYSITLNYEEIGVFFEFGRSKNIKSNDTVQSVYLKSNFPYKTSDGIGIGSTREEIESIMGKPVNFQFEKFDIGDGIYHYIDYEGIMFRFESNHTPIHDTLNYKVKQINIFKGYYPFRSVFVID